MMTEQVSRKSSYAAKRKATSPAVFVPTEESYVRLAQQNSCPTVVKPTRNSICHELTIVSLNFDEEAAALQVIPVQRNKKSKNTVKNKNNLHLARHSSTTNLQQRNSFANTEVAGTLGLEEGEMIVGQQL
jgi:hypothetical protein